ILLLMYYRVGEDASYESVRFIMSQVRFGWLIRSIHSWGANLMILAVFIHMFSVYFTRAYRKPRELTWVSGFLLLVLALFFGFTGYLLPWNQLAFFATRVGTEIVGSVPFIGRELVRILRGSEEVGGATLARFFGLHVALLPGIFTVLLALHLLFVQRQGLAEPESWASRPEAEKRRMPFFPNFLLRDLLLWLIVLNVLAFLAVFYPWELGPKADPLAPAPPGIKPEWYFLFMYQTLKVLPAKIFFLEGEFVGVLFFTLGGLLWMTVPFWEGKVGKYRNQILYLIGWAVLVYIATMTLWGFRS
ncbi:MAG: cytochrome bc complex cytochrome b subunit, partial [Acidobacteriota bacterium]|nr:cytochrome bc complex cytochrome b subunit [Acidobacteriota bacterium]